MAGSKLKKRKDGRYRITVMIPDAAGKNKPHYIYGYTQAETEAKANELIHKRNNGDITNPGKLTVSGYLKTWFDVHKKKLSDTTIDSYWNYIEKHIMKDDLGDILLSKLKPLHIEGFYNNEFEKERKDKKGNIVIGYSGKTVMQEHRILHKAFKHAVRNELLSKNPCDFVDAPRVEEFKPNIYDEDKFNILLNNIEGTRDELPIVLAGMCGLRRSEIFGLRWSDIDFETNKISIEQVAVVTREEGVKIKPRPKNQTSRRTFSIPDAIMPLLKKYKGIGLACHKPDGTPINGGAYSHHFNSLLKKYNLDKIRFHDLRHFNATMMLKYGVSDKEAAKRLGHSNPNTLRKTYQHVLEEMDKHNADKLNSIIRSKTSKGQSEGQT